MLSEQNRDLGALTELYNHAKSDLERIRNQYADDDFLLSFYEGSALRLVKSVQEEIEKALQFGAREADMADISIKLEGPSLDADQVPIGLVGRFLRGISVANKHAVSVLEGLKHGQGRFNKKIHDLAEFSLASVAPGSIEISMRNPGLERFLPIDIASSQQKLFDQVDFKMLSEAWQQSERASEGFQLLLRAIMSSDNEKELLDLMAEVGKRNLLRLLHHAQELTPSKHGDYMTVNIYGKTLPTVTFDLSTREKLKRAAGRLRDNQRYISARGKIRAIDIDNRTIKARPFYFDDYQAEEIEGKLSNDITDEEYELIVNKAVRLSGFIVFSETGDIKHLEVDDIIVDEDDN